MKRYNDLINDALTRVREILPWDLVDLLASGNIPLVIDVREPSEFEHGHIAGSINVPRGILESSCDWDYEDTIPSLAAERKQSIVVICRSGHRSVLAVDTMQQLGFTNVVSLKTGIRGWNDYEQALVDKNNVVIDTDHIEQLLTSRVRPDQLRPK